MHNVVSVDGFIADENDQVGPLFDWYVNGEYGLAEDRQDATGWHPEASYHFVSGRSPPSICSRIPLWSSAATACCTCATGFAVDH